MERSHNDQGKGQNRYPAAFAEALGRTVKVLRTDVGMSRKELAAEAKISYSGLTAIENGNNPPSSSLLVPIANALGVRPSYLLELAEQRMESQDQLDELPSMPYLAEAAITPEQDWAERFGSPERRDRGALLPEMRRESLSRQYLRVDPEERGPSLDRSRRSQVTATAVRELERLLERMAPDDIERLLDYARRLSR